LKIEIDRRALLFGSGAPSIVTDDLDRPEDHPIPTDGNVNMQRLCWKERVDATMPSVTAKVVPST